MTMASNLVAGERSDKFVGEREQRQIREERVVRAAEIDAQAEQWACRAVR
jgi:hypothetical protein